MLHTLRLLTSQFGISEEDLLEYRRRAILKKELFTSYLVRKNVISENQLLEVYSETFRLPLLPRLSLEGLNNNFTKTIPIHFLKRYAIVPLCTADHDQSSESQSGCLIVMNDPNCVHQLDDIVNLLGIESYKIALAPRQKIINAINLAYDLNQDSAEQLVQDMEASDLNNLVEIEVTADLLDETSEAPIIRLANHIISQAAKARASDIHIEPSREQIKVRYPSGWSIV